MDSEGLKLLPPVCFQPSVHWSLSQGLLGTKKVSETLILYGGMFLRRRAALTLVIRRGPFTVRLHQDHTIALVVVDHIVLHGDGGHHIELISKVLHTQQVGQMRSNCPTGGFRLHHQTITDEERV